MSLATTNNATAPAEARGLARDQVRLLVASRHGLKDALFRDLPAHLTTGDLVVVNTSATLPAAVDGWRADGSEVVVHFANALDDGTWVVEVRPPAPSFGPVIDIATGEHLHLPGAELHILRTPPGQRRLHQANLDGSVLHLMEQFGRPIAYGYLHDRWPLADYQTLFATEPGSAEMPSAGRPFTPAVVTELARRGVLLAPVVLHTGVSSPEVGEPPNAERFRVPETTAALVRHVKQGGGRVVAVGTTVTRALETTGGQPGEGWTELVLGPDRPARIVDGLITGWHEPGASHVQLLEAVAGRDLVEKAYGHAETAGYLWHEFGDSCLLLP
jgi:S-adenosylmethionine:tRNA ribosyltransferase-isomerase